MAIAKKHSSSDDDFTKIGPDATATFDNSASNPTEYASSENLDAIEDEDDEDLEDEDLDEEGEEDDEDEDDEEYEEDDDEEDEDEEDEDESDEDDLAKGPKAPSVYRKL